MIGIMTPPSLGDRLKEARLLKGLTLERAAEIIGVKLNTVWRYEKGQIQPSEPVLRLCSQAYEKPMEWFYGYDDPEPEPADPDLDADRQLLMNELDLAFRQVAPELSDEAIRSIAAFIRFTHAEEERERRENEG